MRFMKRAIQLALVLVLLAAAAPAAHAQHRRHGSGISVSSSSVAQLIQGYPAPGLGFDFTHHAAVNRNLATRALIDPVTQHQLALAREIRRETPVVSGGFPVLAGGATVIIIQQPAPVVVVQPGQDSSRPYDRDADELEQRIARLERASYSNRLSRLERLEREESAREEAARENGEPSADADRDRAAQRNSAHPARYEGPRQSTEIVFIRRDGSLIFAVAFARQPERLVYITSDGHRRTLALRDLDLEATLQMNEARGTFIPL